MHQKILNHFRKYDPVLFPYMQRVKLDEWISPKPDAKGPDCFLSLTKKIIFQQLSGKAASTIYQRFSLSLGENITPRKIMSTDHSLFRASGVSAQKASYLIDLAEKYLSREIDLELLPKLSDDEVIADLTKIKGIGRWTAEMFLIFDLAREDVFSFGDQGLKNAIINIYNPPDFLPETVYKIIFPWSPYKTYASLALWDSLDNKYP